MCVKNSSFVRGSNLDSSISFPISLSKEGQYITTSACLCVFGRVCVCVRREKRDSVHKYCSSAPLTM